MTAQGHVVTTDHSLQPMLGYNNVIVSDTWYVHVDFVQVSSPPDGIINVFLGPFLENSNSFTGVFVQEKKLMTRNDCY